MKRLPVEKFVFASFLLLSSCSTLPPKPQAPEVEPDHFTLSSLEQKTAPGCLNMLDQYCNSLYEPGKDGNLLIPTLKGSPISILQGKTSNDLNQVFVELAQSKIRHQHLLPSDFLSVLSAHRYFQKLEDLLHRKPRESMNLFDRMESLEQETEIESLWNLSIQDTLLMRTTHQFPTFPEMRDELKPPEVGHFERQERKNLLSEISRAIWKNHRNWKKVNSTFEELKKTYLQVLSNLNISSALRADWSERIKTMRLVPPGSLPQITDQECASTTVNAYYYSQLNVLTVCAGDFNSEDSLQTLAHEMSHALDLDRSRYLFFKDSTFSEELLKINQGFCSATGPKFSCDQWSHFKSTIEPKIADLAKFDPEVPEFNRCLKRAPTRPLDPEVSKRFAVQSVQGTLRDLVEEEAFLRITRAEIPLSNHRKVKNPSYLNPCFYLQTDWESETIDSELSMLTVFLAEYQCSTETNPLVKLKSSITTTQNIFTGVEQAMIASEGEFSGRRGLIDEDYSSPPNERFADLMGSYVVAESMKNLQSLWDKRVTFLASNSWQCSAPSLTKNFPAESLLLRQYLQDSHTDGEERKKEVLSRPVREALGCTLDFTWKECHL